MEYQNLTQIYTAIANKKLTDTLSDHNWTQIHGTIEWNIKTRKTNTGVSKEPALVGGREPGVVAQ